MVVRWQAFYHLAPLMPPRIAALMKPVVDGDPRRFQMAWLALDGEARKAKTKEASEANMCSAPANF